MIASPERGGLFFCNINFSCYNNSGCTAAKNKKRPGVRDVFCYDIGIIGDLSTSHRGVREVVRGCYMLSLSMVLVYTPNVFVS